MKSASELYQGLYICFQDTHTSVYTLTLMEGEAALFGPVKVPKSAFRDRGNRNLLMFSCGAPPTKFEASNVGGKEIGYNLAVIDEKVARDWFGEMAKDKE